MNSYGRSGPHELFTGVIWKKQMPNKQPVRGVYGRHEEGEIGLNRKERERERERENNPHCSNALISFVSMDVRIFKRDKTFLAIIFTLLSFLPFEYSISNLRRIVTMLLIIFIRKTLHIIRGQNALRSRNDSKPNRLEEKKAADEASVQGGANCIARVTRVYIRDRSFPRQTRKCTLVSWQLAKYH